MFPSHETARLLEHLRELADVSSAAHAELELGADGGHHEHAAESNHDDSAALASADVAPEVLQPGAFANGVDKFRQPVLQVVARPQARDFDERFNNLILELSHSVLIVKLMQESGEEIARLLAFGQYILGIIGVEVLPAWLRHLLRQHPRRVYIVAHGHTVFDRSVH